MLIECRGTSGIGHIANTLVAMPLVLVASCHYSNDALGTSTNSTEVPRQVSERRTLSVALP